MSGLDFAPVTLEERSLFSDALQRYQPETSELTFTNLFIWRDFYGFQWARHGDSLVVVSTKEGQDPWALPPVGPGSRVEAVRAVLEWLKAERGVARPRIDRADSRLVSELEASAPGEFLAEPRREHFDYVYKTQDLIALSGSKYHGKRNHIHRFTEAHVHTYARLDESGVSDCLMLAELWCEFRRCEEDMNLLGEWDAVKEALGHFRALGLRGGLIQVEGKVQAFALAELLNGQSAVVHIEKGNPELQGVYAVINQEFCRNEWAGVPFINREQDLGEEGLRKAKLSYHPARLVEKFAITPAA